MKEDILITETDYTRLCNMIQLVKSSKNAEGRNLEALGSEIKRAKRVDSRKITPEYITMNSVIELTDLDTGRIMNLKLVYPDDADFTKGLCRYYRYWHALMDKKLRYCYF
jgi:regulator of nucleoside diphosphate kinase